MRELIDEIQKKRKDERVNAELYTVVKKEGEFLKRSDQIKVGDILKLSKG